MWLWLVGMSLIDFCIDVQRPKVDMDSFTELQDAFQIWFFNDA